MLQLKVNNIISGNGNAIANQFEVKDYQTNTVYFQSYESIIAKIQDGKITVDPDYWDYSKTTSKYLNIFFDDFNYSEISDMNHEQKAKYFTENNCFKSLN